MAQTPSAKQVTPAQWGYNKAVKGCTDALRRKAAPEKRISACAGAITNLDAIYTALGTPSGHDGNLFHVERGLAFTQIAGAYGEMDQARSPRMCFYVEKVWAELAALNDAASPESYQEDFAALRKSATQVVAACRNEMGGPPNAPPLP